MILLRNMNRLVERYGPIYNFARSVTAKLIPAEQRPVVRRKLYDLEDFARFEVPHLLYYGKRDMFEHAYFEANAACNWNKCWYCPQTTDRRASGQMSDQVFESMLSQLQKLGRRGFKGVLGPVFFNEPTMLGERLAEMMGEAHKRLPLAWLQINTNGITLTPNYTQKLLDAGVNQIIVTKHDGAPTKNLDQVLAAMPEEQERGRIIVRTLDEIKLWNRAGLVNVPQNKVLHLERCRMASNQLTLDWRGNVIFCCNDYKTRHVEGNITKRSIKEIWEDPIFVARREQARRGLYTLALCRSCMGIDRSTTI